MYSNTGKTQGMLEEALQFVDPDCESRFRMAIVGRDMEHAEGILLRRFAEMLTGAGHKFTSYGPNELVVGNTRIRFVSGMDANAFRGANESTVFEDHTVVEQEKES